MAFHRQQAQFDRARWRMNLLLPCWVVQILLMLVLIGLFSYRLAHTVTKSGGENKTAVEFVWEVTGIAFPLLSLSLTIFEIAKLAAEILTPWTMLFTHVLKVVTACGSLSIDVVWYLKQKDRRYSIIGLVLDIVLLLIILIPAIYSIRTYRRLSTDDDYHHPANAKSFGYRDIEDQQSPQLHPSNVKGRLSIGTIRTVGAASIRRLSYSSVGTTGPNPPLAADTEDDANPQQQQHSIPLENYGRTPSYYNHERDTQFEKYMVERAMASEFSSGGFGSNRGRRSGSFGSNGGGRSERNGTPGRSASNATDASAVSSATTSSGSTLGVSQGSIVVGGGSASNSKALTDSMGRAPSWASSHVLVAVPEEGPEHNGDGNSDDAHAGKRGNAGQGDVREALLGDSNNKEGWDEDEDEVTDDDRRQQHRDEARAALELEELDLGDTGDRKRKRDG